MPRGHSSSGPFVRGHTRISSSFAGQVRGRGSTGVCTSRSDGGVVTLAHFNGCRIGFVICTSWPFLKTLSLAEQASPGALPATAAAISVSVRDQRPCHLGPCNQHFGALDDILGLQQCLFFRPLDTGRSSTRQVTSRLVRRPLSRSHSNSPSSTLDLEDSVFEIGRAAVIAVDHRFFLMEFHGSGRR